jgi:hypothetical protein
MRTKKLKVNKKFLKCIKNGHAGQVGRPVRKPKENKEVMDM